MEIALIADVCGGALRDTMDEAALCTHCVVLRGARYVPIGIESRLNVGIAIGAATVVYDYIKSNNPYWVAIVLLCTEANPTIACACRGQDRARMTQT